MSIIEKQKKDERGTKKRRRFGWSTLSYATRMTMSFAAIAALTALVAIGVLSFVWDHHFRDYTSRNLQKIAEATAEEIADTYLQTGTLDSEEVFSAANYSAEYFGPRVEIFGWIGDDEKAVRIWDTQWILFGDGGRINLPELDAADTSTSIIQDIVVTQDGTKEAVGYVRIWVSSTETVLTKIDEQFRVNSYQAMIFATGFAIVLAMCIGFLFARKLVTPINTMMRTAEAIKEGDMEARTNLTGNDEVARLGKTFDAMADSIEKDRELERRLTTDVAHELRTPLMAIQSTVEAMVDGVFKADVERLETVNSEVQRLSRLVDALLRLSRLESRNTPMKEEVVNVGELIAGIIATHEAFVNDSGLTMEFQSDDEVYVYGDADMIRQATANLISNAVRYTPEGGHITVQVRKGDIMAAISVKDTGVGLTQEEAKMVFSRFWRADAGRNREYGGLGVGLAVVKEIIDRHGGWVQVEGKPNEGAIFTLFIPLYDEEAVRLKLKSKGKKPKR